MKTAFIGHRQICAKEIEKRLLLAIENEISLGCRSFTMGTHGVFDSLALCACRRFRRVYSDIEIEAVITSLNALKKNGESSVLSFGDIKTVMYDIESVYFKKRITLSNRKMLDGCDTLICYVDTTIGRSGAKEALRYAEKIGLKIINLYRDCDKILLRQNLKKLTAP